MNNQRADKLKAMLAKTPDDPFLLYALGMEMKKSDSPEAIRLFQRAIQVDSRQCYAYFQLGQTHEAAGDTQAARTAYRDGMAAAARTGDQHAAQEIEAALQMLGDE